MLVAATLLRHCARALTAIPTRPQKKRIVDFSLLAIYASASSKVATLVSGHRNARISESQFTEPGISTYAFLGKYLVSMLRHTELTEITNGDFLAGFKNFLQLFFLPVALLTLSAFVFD